MSSVETKAEIWQCTNEEYHADHARIGHSMLDVFRASRKRYHGQYVAGTLPRSEPSDAMILGSLIHMAALEPERFALGTIVAPKVDRRTTVGKADWQAFLDAAGGKQVISAEQSETVNAVADAVRDHELANRLLSCAGLVESAITWTDEATGLELKSRRDKVVIGKELLIDLKTCRDASPEGFAKAAANFGYHRQAAFYLDGQHALTGQFWSFVFIAVETAPPYQVACYELDSEALSLGSAQNETALVQLADCYRTGNWVAPFEARINEISLPSWANYQDQWSE